MEKLYSVKDAAKQLGVSKWTLHSWLSRGKLQRTKVGGRTMIRESELERVPVDGGKTMCGRAAVPKVRTNSGRQAESLNELDG